MGGAPQVTMRVASQIWQIVFASQTLQVFRLALRKKAQYVVVFVFTISNFFSIWPTFVVGCCCEAFRIFAKVGLLDIV